jgi:hypothetical protein
MNKPHSFENLYRKEFALIFPKWIKRNTSSNIGKYCRSSLEQPAIFLSTKYTQETAAQNVCIGPNFIPRKLCLHICRWNLPQPNRTKFTYVNVQVKNKTKHLHNTIQHARTSQASLSLLNFHLYSRRRQQASSICHYSAEHYCMSASTAMVQFKPSSPTSASTAMVQFKPSSPTYCLLFVNNFSAF